jgi:hypothetical protein
VIGYQVQRGLRVGDLGHCPAVAGQQAVQIAAQVRVVLHEKHPATGRPTGNGWVDAEHGPRGQPPPHLLQVSPQQPFLTVLGLGRLVDGGAGSAPTRRAVRRR